MSHEDREGSRPSDRDVPLENAWRQASTEQPPASLDAAIIEAARSSIRDAKRRDVNVIALRQRPRGRFAQWQSVAAAAAIAGLAFVLVPRMQRESDRVPTLQRSESAAAPEEAAQSERPTPAHAPSYGGPNDDRAVDVAPAPGRAAEAPMPGDRYSIPEPGTRPSPEPVPAPAPAGPAQAPAAAATAEPPAASPTTATPAPAVQRPVTAESTSTSAVAPQDAAGSADSSAPLGAAGAERRKAETTAEMNARSSRSTIATASKAEPDDAELSRDDAVAWAQRIAATYAAGDFVSAESELRAFRAAEPGADEYLPQSLRNWARTVK